LWQTEREKEEISYKEKEKESPLWGDHRSMQGTW
jgi:hypothetical protein